MSRDSTIWIGTRATAASGDGLFGLNKKAMRHHLYVIGKSGMGKTTLLRNQLVQLIAQGKGVCLIDPHGDLAQEILYCIPPHRIQDTIYFNPEDTEYPIGINPLHNVFTHDHDKVAEDILGIFKSIWGDSWGPRMEYILRNSLAALLEIPGSTLLGVARLYHDDRYRNQVVRRIKNPGIKHFWTNEYLGYMADRRHREYVAPIENKIGRLTSNQTVRNVLGQSKNRLQMRKIMDEGKILIANLSKGALGDSISSLLGSILVSMIQQAAMSRRDIPERYRRDFYLIVDEFQNFTTDNFASILSEARKYRLNLTLSHQYINQVPETIQDAVFGNVGSLISFRIGAHDSKRLASEMDDEWPARRFVELEPYEVLAKMNQHGGMPVPFLAKTLHPIETSFKRSGQIIKHSNANNGTERGAIERKLSCWYQD